MKTKLVFLLISLIWFKLYSQDRQFWDQAIGGKAALMGGVTLAGVRDYSATFYNPGALSFISKNSLSVNFNMYGIKDWQFINGGGPGIDSRYTRVSLYPASLAGPLPFLGDSTNRFSYIIYCNGYSYVRVSERYEGYVDVIPTRPSELGNSFQGDEYLVNQGKLDALLNEVSVGFGYSRKVSEHIGLGFTLIGAYRDQTKIRYEAYAAYDTTNQRTATSDLYVDLDYWAIRFSGKFGIAAEWNDFKFGATLTTPSLAIKLASGGTDYVGLTSNNVYVAYDSARGQYVPVDILASDRQEGLPVTYKSPFSIALGIEYKFSNETIFDLAMEWFAPLPVYVVIQPESGDFVMNDPLTIKPRNSAEMLRVYDATQNVFNVGIAVEQKLTDKFTGYAAIRTDFSNADIGEIDGLFVGFTDIDIYHFTFGFSTEMNNTFIGVGFEYSRGQNSNFPQIFNFPSGQIEPDDVTFIDRRGTCEAIYNNFNLFFGVTQLL